MRTDADGVDDNELEAATQNLDIQKYPTASRDREVVLSDLCDALEHRFTCPKLDGYATRLGWNYAYFLFIQNKRTIGAILRPVSFVQMITHRPIRQV